jgi:hypothetical protein
VRVDQLLPGDRADLLGEHVLVGQPDAQLADADHEHAQHGRRDQPGQPRPPAHETRDPRPHPVVGRHVGVQRPSCGRSADRAAAVGTRPEARHERPEQPASAQHQQRRQQRRHRGERREDTHRRDRAEAAGGR